MFYSRFSRVPVKVHGINAKRFGIYIYTFAFPIGLLDRGKDVAMCKILTTMLSISGFISTNVELWKLIKIKVVDWLRVCLCTQSSKY